MSDVPPDQQAVIVDRGYRHYEGVRTGRRGAMLAILREGYRRALGLRRKAKRKVPSSLSPSTSPSPSSAAALS